MSALMIVTQILPAKSSLSILFHDWFQALQSPPRFPLNLNLWTPRNQLDRNKNCGKPHVNIFAPPSPFVLVINTLLAEGFMYNGF